MLANHSVKSRMQSPFSPENAEACQPSSLPIPFRTLEKRQYSNNTHSNKTSSNIFDVTLSTVGSSFARLTWENNARSLGDMSTQKSSMSKSTISLSTVESNDLKSLRNTEKQQTNTLTPSISDSCISLSTVESRDFNAINDTEKQPPNTPTTLKSDSCISLSTVESNDFKAICDTDKQPLPPSRRANTLSESTSRSYFHKRLLVV